MDQDAVPSNGRDWWIAYDWNAGETYSSLASSTGRELMQASARVASGDISASNVAYDGEDILYTMSMPVAEGGPQAQVALDINTFTYYRDDLTHAERLSSGTLTFTVPATDARTIYAAKTPIDLPLAGMTLTEATLELTPIATYLTCAYSLNEDATDLQGLNMHDGLWPRWLDADGNALADGQTQQSMDTSTDEVRLITSYPAMETAPEEITIEFFNGMTKERFDAPTLTLSKQEGETK